MGGQDDPDEFNRYYLDRLAQGSSAPPRSRRTLPRPGAPLHPGHRHQRRLPCPAGPVPASPLPPLFSGLFISGELGYHKPQREFFDIVLREMDIRDPSRVVVVGDNLLSDIQGGVNAGLDTVWYNPHGLPNSTGLRPTFEAADYDALRSFLLS